MVHVVAMTMAVLFGMEVKMAVMSESFWTVCLLMH
jgi:hypothetical protein